MEYRDRQGNSHPTAKDAVVADLLHHLTVALKSSSSQMNATEAFADYINVLNIAVHR